MVTTNKKDSDIHYIHAFEVNDDPKKESKEVRVMSYAAIAKEIKSGKNEYILHDEEGKDLELYEKDGSIFMKRDQAEFTQFRGNVRMNERYDPNIEKE